MKTNHQSPAPISPTSINQEHNKRKVLLFAPDAKAAPGLRRAIHEAGHYLTQSDDDAQSLIHEIARTNPHLLVMHVPDTTANENLQAKMASFFPDLRICVLLGDLGEGPDVWKQTLREALARPIELESPRHYAADSRVVLHDEPLRAYWKGKLNRPQRTEGWQKTCAQQEARFVMQLQTARKNHQAAKKYYLCLLAQQTGLDQEIAYRLAHGSYKALSWSRELACKWLALLAHYLPDTELDYLPRAGTPGPTIDFVHHAAPMEGVYAATLLIMFKVKPSIVEGIKQVLTTRFEGQDDDKLLALSLTLYGMAKLLQQVGTAQIELMEAWLDPSLVDRPNDVKVPRGEHRNAGLYRDFYDLGFIICSPEPLAAILKGFHAGTTYVQHGRLLPSFGDIQKLSREAGFISAASSNLQ